VLQQEDKQNKVFHIILQRKIRWVRAQGEEESHFSPRKKKTEAETPVSAGTPRQRGKQSMEDTKNPEIGMDRQNINPETFLGEETEQIQTR
jgi:hypothetical protein